SLETATKTASGASASRMLPDELADRLAERARRARVTLNTLFQAAWAVLLSRYCPQSEVLFGAKVGGQPPELAGSDQMIGPFINTVPVRETIAGESLVEDLLLRLQDHAAACGEYAYLSLSEIQNNTGIRGDELFDTILVFENYPTRIDGPSV